MDSEAVVCVLSALKQGGLRAWIGGGWGIDALLGRQSREHDDLDLAISAEDESSALELLEDLGYKPVSGLDWRPVRVALRDQLGRQVDLHPVVFDEHGDGLQANLDGLPPFSYPAQDLVQGSIAGIEVLCISPRLQRQFHSGYPLSGKDNKDLAELESLRVINV